MGTNAVAGGWIDARPLGYVNAGNYGAEGNGVADDAPAIQAAINAATTTVGGVAGNVVWLGQGTYLLGSQLVVKDEVRLVGVGRTGTLLKAKSGVAPATGLVRIGAGTGNVFGARLENLTVDCADEASSIGIYTSEGQEQSGVRDCLIRNFRGSGIVLDSGSQHAFVEGCEIYGSSVSAPTNGILVQNAGGTAYIHRCTIAGTGAQSVANGINITGSRCEVGGIHVETCTDGIEISGSGSAGTVIASISGHSTVTNVLNITTFNDLTISGILRNGATNGLAGSAVGTLAADCSFFTQNTDRTIFRPGAQTNSGLDIFNNGNRSLSAGDGLVRIRNANTGDSGALLVLTRLATDNVAQISLGSAGDNPSSPATGDVWRNGDSIKFQGSRLFSMLGGYDGAFTATAAGVTTVSSTNVTASSRVVFSSTNAAAATLLQAKRCWVDTIAAGSFVFNVSATGAGAPTGTETFSYWVS